jgi:hypothetical protein
MRSLQSGNKKNSNVDKNCSWKSRRILKYSDNKQTVPFVSAVIALMSRSLVASERTVKSLTYSVQLLMYAFVRRHHMNVSKAEQ